jgi:hypothetical protein
VAFKSADARRNSATPGWAWAVAGLCGLLLIPVALENHHFLRKVAPMHLASAADRAAQLALAGHHRPAGRATTHTSGLGQTWLPAAGLGAGSEADGALGRGLVGHSLAAPGAAGASPATSGLALQSPSGALGPEGTVPLTLSPVVASSPRLVAPVLDNDSVAAGRFSWTGHTQTVIAGTARRTSPTAALSRHRSVSPRLRLWAKARFRLGPASRVRRRHNARFFGFFLSAH